MISSSLLENLEFGLIDKSIYRIRIRNMFAIFIKAYASLLISLIFKFLGFTKHNFFKWFNFLDFKSLI